MLLAGIEIAVKKFAKEMDLIISEDYLWSWC
jgi:hypothetical protein